MKTSNAAILDLSDLPEQVRQEVTDFYQFLKNKYHIHTTRRRKKSDMPVQALSDNSFVGIWKDRPEMDDAAGRVREQREAAWSRHE
ncbi:MAG TPA: DUF2281 domain-containing protein [Desulfuromonadales bacterium]|nr:DUF2281 domain-containing protein [Desulfuromonadales bacterium]